VDARFIRKIKLCKFIKNTLKIENHGRNFTIVEKGNNLFEDTRTVREEIVGAIIQAFEEHPTNI
jgi:hypothetical protein